MRGARYYYEKVWVAGKVGRFDKVPGTDQILIAAIIVGAAVYFAIIYFMKIEEVDSMIDAVKGSAGND